MSARLLVALIAVAAGACRDDWRTDMWYQPAIGAEEMPRPQPPRSIPLGAGPAIADRDDAADLLQNPVAADERSLARGEAIFVSRCSPCHGAGHGGGPVSKFFPQAPDLAYPVIVARNDGYLFGTIVYGGKAMPPQADGLSDRDRWDVVNYVRKAIQQVSP